MRYRPFGRAGAAVSALSLGLTDQPMRTEQRTRLIYAALEAGINTFDIHGRDPHACAAIGEALSAIERHMIFVSLRVGWSLDRHGARVRDLSPDGVSGAIEQVLAQTRLGFIDVAVLDLIEGERVPTHVVAAMKSAKAAHRVRMIGVAGAEAADPFVDSAEFDVLVTPFNLQSGWIERNRLRRAGQSDMVIIGTDFHPAWLHPGDPNERQGHLDLRRLLGRKEKAPTAYTFLEHNPGWTAEQICLGFALTEPSLASVETCLRDIDALEALATVVDRELPTGLSAQIEMARISFDQENAALAKRGAGA